MNSSHIGWWKRALSYFVDIPIQSTGSQINPFLNVNLVRNRLQLSTQKSIYSYDDLYTNFYRAFQQIELPPEGTTVLVLGLGLGSIPFMLEKSFEKRYNYLTVELDESVIRLASDFSLKRIESPIQVIHADAEIFVQTHTETYDLIIVDLFLEDIIPAYFESKKGNEVVKGLLSDGGTVLYNRLYRTGRDKLETDKFYQRVFTKVYEDARFIDADGNWILVGGT